MKKPSKLITKVVVPLLAFGIAKEVKARSLSNAESVVTGNFNLVFTTKNLPFGYNVGKGPHHQSTFNLNFKNFNAFTWSDFDYGGKETLENDYGVGYTKKLNDRLSVSGRFMHWSYLKQGFDNLAHIAIFSSGVNVNYSVGNFDVSAFIKGQLGFIKETKSGMPLKNVVSFGMSVNAPF